VEITDAEFFAVLNPASSSAFLDSLAVLRDSSA
jgi:hypothetical protein